MDQQEQTTFPQYTPAPPWPPYTPPPAPAERPAFPTGKKELLFALGAVFSALALVNCLLFGGANLGFALAMICSLSFATAYLWSCGKRPNGYNLTISGLSIAIAAGFIRSDDGFVKFVMMCFLLVAINLSLCLQSGQNLRPSSGVTSLLDAPRALFIMGIGKLPESFRGLHRAAKNGGEGSKKTGAVLLGLVIVVPVMLIVLPLLISADAAFEGLWNLLPDFEIAELMVTLILGSGLTCLLYSRTVALRHAPTTTPSACNTKKVSALTINTVLIALCFVYVVYLFSQLAYFSGGLAGVLPEGFTMAEYARRGFFEMAWLCLINLTIISLAVGLVAKEEKTPLLTRLLCLFIGVVTVFFVVTASAKMGMYIQAYGLTRLRVLTEVIMVFFGLATMIVSIWLFVPKMAYMKVILILALAMGATVLWADVDTVVASYNVHAYQSGALNTVDVEYLTELSSGAVPYIIELAENGNSEAAAWLQENSSVYYWTRDFDDLRSWNIADWLAGKLIYNWKNGK